MKSKKQIEALLEQQPDNAGYWDGHRAALRWVLNIGKRNPLGAWGVYVDPVLDEVNEEVLLPCPHCGGEPRWGETPDGGHFIECSACQTSTNLTYYLMDDASRDVSEKWNRRVKGE